MQRLVGRRVHGNAPSKFSGPAFFCAAFLSFALTRPLHRGQHSVVPSGDSSHAPPGCAAFWCEGRRTEDAQQSRKKKTMKTNTQSRNEGTREQIRTVEQSNTEAQGAVAPAQAQKPDNRLPIDSEARRQNRTLPTPKVLNALLTSLPDVYRTAEVVGKWVWVQFKEQPAAEIRQQLAQLGFHWNRERQAWQHPCGHFSLGSQADPHEKYSSYHPARVRRSNKPQTAPAAA